MTAAEPSVPRAWLSPALFRQFFLGFAQNYFSAPRPPVVRAEIEQCEITPRVISGRFVVALRRYSIDSESAWLDTYNGRFVRLDHPRLIEFELAVPSYFSTYSNKVTIDIESKGAARCELRLTQDLGLDATPNAGRTVDRILHGWTAALWSLDRLLQHG